MRRTIIRFAENHRGLVTTARLRAAGSGPGRVRHWQRSGRLRRVRPRVYAAAGSPRTWEQGLQAVILSAPHAVASHECALRVLGVRRGATDYEVATDRGRRVLMAGVREHRSSCWLPEDRWVRGGLACTSPARTVVDLSGRLTVVELGRLVDELVRRRLLRMRDLARTAGWLRSGPGRRPSQVQQVLRARIQGYEPGDSELEARVIRALAAAGLPAPTAQHRVRVDGRRYRVDLAYPALRMAIEIDSWAYHRWRSSFDGDRVRRNDLTLVGYSVIHVTDGMPDGEIVAVVARGLEVLGHREVP